MSGTMSGGVQEPIEYRLIVPLNVRFMADHDQVLRQVAQIGRRTGRDDDWAPEHIDEAIYEALLYARTPQDCAMVFLDPSREPDAGTYAAWIELMIFPDVLEKHKGEALPRPAGFKPTLNALLLPLLNSDTPPLDMGFEIIGHSRPANLTTAHGRLQVRARVQACQWSGPTDSLFAAEPD